jgi:lysophospholipase L1-like esterase
MSSSAASADGAVMGSAGPRSDTAHLARRAAVLGAAPALGGLCWALCAWEARHARQGPRPYETALPADGRLGPPGTPIRVTWLGDSLAAGLGVDDVADTPAHAVARLLDRPVEVTMLAVPGARASHVLAEQLPRLGPDTDLVILSVGANDVASSCSREHYAGVVDRLLTAIAPIPTVMLSLPDMATADRMAEPLRTLAGARARWFEAARARVAAGHAHVRSVDVATPPPGMSRRALRAFLSADRFHPGPHGYRWWAERIATTAHDLLPALELQHPVAA